jgi:hypothetical protein
MMARGRGHHHHGIIGKAGQAHICSTSNRTDSFRIAIWLRSTAKSRQSESR